MFKRNRAGKKVLSVLVSIVTVMSLMTVPAFAAEDTKEPVEVVAEEGETKTEEVGDVDIIRESGDDQSFAAEVRGEGGEAALKTGDITGSGEEKVIGVAAYSYNEGTAEVWTGNIDTNGGGVESLSRSGGDSFVAVDGSINSEDFGVYAGAGEEDSLAGVSVEGDVKVETEHNDSPAVFSYAVNKGEADTAIAGDVNSTGDGVNAVGHYGGTANVIVLGNVTSSGTAEPRSDNDYLTAAGVEAYGEGSKAETIVAGDVTMENDKGVALMLKAGEDTEASMTVGGTVKGGDIPVMINTRDKDFSNISLTVWKIEPNADGEVARSVDQDQKTVERCEEFEKTINYIIRIEETSDADLSAQDTAHEGEKVILKVNVKDGYEPVGAYNGVEEKVPLVKDANGDWYVIVPKGGGVYLSVELRKKESHKKDDDDKKDNKVTAAATTTTTGAAYASADSFAAAGVSMIASAASGSTVTMDATSFTSLPANTAAALMARPDVTFVFTYMLNGVRYTVTIPAGTNIAALLNSSGGIDFASLASFTAAG